MNATKETKYPGKTFRVEQSHDDLGGERFGPRVIVSGATFEDAYHQWKIHGHGTLICEQSERGLADISLSEKPDWAWLTKDGEAYANP